jgi:hypothetical protein
MKKPRRQINHDLLTSVARIYTLSAEKGMNPIQALMYFYPNAHHRTVQDYATTARKQGYLKQTTSGKVTI